MAKSRSSTPTSTPKKDDNALVRYYKETRAELRKVTWPTPDETRNLTYIIVVVTIAMAIFLGGLDFIFEIIAEGIILLNPVYMGIAVAMFLAAAAVFYYNGLEE